MNLGAPTSIECIQQVGGSDERYPLLNGVRWNFPARGDMPPVKVHWFDGYLEDAACGEKNKKSDAEKTLNCPPLALELQKKYGRDLSGGGVIFVGDKGDHGHRQLLREPPHPARGTIPQDPRAAEDAPPREEETHQADFLRACKDGHKPSSHFGYSGRLSEMVLLGCLAIRAGVGNPVEWDAVNMTTNNAAANRLLKREYRKGWELLQSAAQGSCAYTISNTPGRRP